MWAHIKRPISHFEYKAQAIARARRCPHHLTNFNTSQKPIAIYFVCLFAVIQANILKHAQSQCVRKHAILFKSMIQSFFLHCPSLPTAILLKMLVQCTRRSIFFRICSTGCKLNVNWMSMPWIRLLHTRKSLRNSFTHERHHCFVHWSCNFFK